MSQTDKVEAKVVLAIHPVISSNSPSLPTPLRTGQSSLAAHPSACVGKHEYARRLDEYFCNSYLALGLRAFAQLSYSETFRDIEAHLRSIKCTLYHVGLPLDVP